MRRRVAHSVIAAAMVVALAGCGSETDSGAGSTDDPPAVDPPAVDFELLSAQFDHALVALPDGAYAVIDGGDHGSGSAETTNVWVIDGDGERSIATLPSPMRTPLAWSSEDGTVTVVGMDCQELEDDLDQQMCPQAPLVAATIDLDGTYETFELDVVTDGSAGFSAGPLGDQGIALVTVHPATAESRVITLAAPDDEAVDHGPGAARMVCNSSDGTFLVPSENSPDGNDQVVQITDEGLVEIGEIDAPESELTTATGCGNGTVMVRAMVGGEVRNFTFAVDSPGELTELDVPEEYAAGEVAIGSAGQAFSWSNDDGAWQLAEEQDGSWVPIASVASAESPYRTVGADGSYATLTTGEGGSVFAIVP